ncbi:MAG: L-threonylcarbamoyladenylate synthase [Gammaproteobacteria bacterium]|nr:L-threonylcarbamoyladenylate synthase [Gammaproteobacteria bacterium]MCY4218997.1 L-threonylcarbamoyladenylate synthase [Gammaproteobacteria bacterium]MCY4274977.1 L-threonylcarbamoyladenylate synthase [Gammaproteobacteria bacterium]
MSQYFSIHKINPQPRLIHEAVKIINAGGIIAYPTDSSYALGCEIGNKEAMQRIRQIRKLDNAHNFTLICKDLSELSLYAKIDNAIYRLLKRFTPGPYTFILKASREVPRRLQNPKRKTIGLRIPKDAVVSALLEHFGQPLMSSTLLLPDDDYPLNDPVDIRERLENQVDLIIDAGPCDAKPTSVIDLVDRTPRILRHGKGDTKVFEPVA